MNTPPDKQMNPGDEAPPDTPGTGEDICPMCKGTGKIENGRECPNCGGTGKIIEGVGGG
jgi:RecJ-like exonuclease